MLAFLERERETERKRESKREREREGGEREGRKIEIEERQNKVPFQLLPHITFPSFTPLYDYKILNPNY